MKGRRKKLLVVVGGIIGVMFFYFLSMGPVLRFSVDTRFERAVERLYSPLLNSGDTPAWPVVRWYLRVWDLYHPIIDSTPLPRAK
jgi:hypothetical protein